MTGGGFAGNILHVDLAERKIRKEPLDPRMAEDFVGGLGLTVKLAYDAIRPGTDALSPDNPIVLGAGALVGTGLPAASRVFAVSKLPTSGTIGWCGSGGVTFGYLLKNAGYDHVVIQGKADRPVFLRLFDDDVEICDAGRLWGRGAGEASEALWDQYDRPLGVLAIGPAGENRIPFSMAFIDRIATLGRGGLGAVFGAKNLKAVVVRGTRGIRVADRKRYRALVAPFLKTIRGYPHLKEWQELGLVKSFPMIPLEIYRRIKKRRIACVSCPVGCKDVVQIADGAFQGMVVCNSSVMNLFMGVIYGLKDYRESIKLIHTLDDLGVDMFEFFALMRLVEALEEEGIIPKGEVDPPVSLSSLSSLETWAHRVTRREGLGQVLAGGFTGVIEAFGPGAAQLAPPLVKGMHPYAGPGAAVDWDLFGTMELGQVLDPRGPHVGASGSPTYFARRPVEVFPKHMHRMGVPEDAFPRILPGLGSAAAEQDIRVGRLLKYSHRWFTTLGSLGICARAAVNRFYSANLCVDFYGAVTGIESDLPGFMKRVDRVWTLLRLAGLREGMERKTHEALPEKWFHAPGFKDYATEKPLDREGAERMIEDYYDEWGWDRETGVPAARALRELGLDGVEA